MQLLTVATFVVRLSDEIPEDNDVVAGWTAFLVFIGLALAVAFLGFSLTKQLRKAQAAEDAGLYDPSDRTPATPIPMASPDSDETGPADQPPSP